MAPTKKSSKAKKPAKATGKNGTKKSSKSVNGKKNGQPGEELQSADVRHSYISGATFGLKKVQYGAVDGDAVFEGDILPAPLAKWRRSKSRLRIRNPMSSLRQWL